MTHSIFIFIFYIPSRRVRVIHSLIHSFIPQILIETLSNNMILLRSWTINIMTNRVVLKRINLLGEMYFAFHLNNLPLLDSLINSSIWV